MFRIIIYKVTNIINGKIYIGQTTRELEVRKKEHFYHASYEDNNSVFHKALRKYCVDSFIWEVIDTAYSQKELNEKEIYWIQYYDSFGENGYNLTNGGASGGNAKFKKSDILRIKDMIKNKIPIKEIASDYNVDRDVITRIKCGRYWSHIGEDVSTIKYPSLSNAKLTEENVREIKLLLREDKLTQREIAEMFEVTSGTIANIRTGKVWANIGEDLSLIKFKNKKEKLTEEKVIEIKHLIKEGKLRQIEIAKLYKVGKGVISDINVGRTWKHIVD